MNILQTKPREQLNPFSKKCGFYKRYWDHGYQLEYELYLKPDNGPMKRTGFIIRFFDFDKDQVFDKPAKMSSDQIQKLRKEVTIRLRDARKSLQATNN
jgi:hypothetical protein